MGLERASESWPSTIFRSTSSPQVTPLTVQGYLACRIAVPMAVSVLVMMASIAIADLVEMGVVAAFP